jgi:hypothetical protein
MSDAPISDHDRDLAELAAASRADQMLGILAGQADTGATFSLGLLVNGMTIYGRTASRREVARALDDENARMIERSRASGGSGWDEAEETIKGQWMRNVEEAAAEERLLVEHTTGDLHAVPEEIARMIIRSRETTITLTDVHVFTPGDPRFELPLLQIRLATVAGWWLVPTDEHGTVAYRHPSIHS